MKDVKGRVTNIETDMRETKDRVTNIETDNAGMKSTLEDTHKRVILIENDHGQSLKALHDGYSLLYDRTEMLIRKTDDMHNDIIDIKNNQVAHDARITELEYERSIQ